MNYLLNVDFLEFRASSQINLNNFLSGGIYKFSNGLFLVIVKDYGYLKQTYSYCFRIYYKNDEVGFFYSKSLDLSETAGFDTMVRIDNKVFYVYSLGTMLKMIVEALGLLKTMTKRLDICYDTDFDVLSRFKTLYYDTATKFKFRNKINVNGTGPDDKLLFIGGLTSRTKCIGIYNKTKELRSTNNKQYINDLHKEIFGLKTIYRVELKLMSKIIGIKGIDIMKLENTDYLELIYNTYFDTLIQFSDINSSGEKIEFITLNNTGLRLQKSIRQKINSGGKRIKEIINFLDKEIKTNEFRGLIKVWNTLRTIMLTKYGLNAWYMSKKRV